MSGEEDGDPLPNGGHNVLALGGLAVSRYKIRVHRAAVEGLFKREAVVLGPVEIARLAREIITPSLD